MTLLEIAGNGLFEHAPDFFRVVATTFKLIGGSFLILLLALLSFAGIIARSVYIGILHSSFIRGFRTLIRATAYAIGVSLAMIFLLVASTFFSISGFKLFAIAFVIAFVVSFIARETFMFLLLKRFGKYIFYLTTLHRAGKVAYNYVKEENTKTNP
ncbi:MAG: hypothetical protein ACHQIM_22065 [Sphingobacteriales bacterium]